YDQGKWTSPGESRRLRLLGLAKYQDGELVVRNSIFRGVAEGWLYQGEPGGSKLITGREVREGAVFYEKIDRAKEAHEKLDAKSPGPDTKRLDRGLEQGAKEECINNNGKNEMGTGGVPITLYRESKELILDGKAIPLTPVEYRIVESLLSNYPRVLSKDNLAQAAFPFEPVPLTDVESHIKNIRRKLGDKPKRPRFIRCRRGFGYQAVADSFTLS
ncbi:MAG TPA: winged helix-turn-helix domain-containing protein, partial [Verrucomicrobiae bacterium]|nr:winged helix-turn-helix domain-containing protein [Verrucomicrobiae bacterium]